MEAINNIINSLKSYSADLTKLINEIEEKGLNNLISTDLTMLNNYNDTVIDLLKCVQHSKMKRINDLERNIIGKTIVGKTKSGKWLKANVTEDNFVRVINNFEFWSEYNEKNILRYL